MHVLVIANGSKPKALKTLRRMAQWTFSDCQFDLHTTSHSGECSRLITTASPIPQVVIAIGGDGTVHECLQGLMQLTPEVRPALLVVPCGTGNDYARSFTTPPLTANQLEHLLKQNKRIVVDVLRIQLDNGAIVYSNNITDVGLGPMAVKATNALPKWIPGKIRFFLGIAKTLWAFQPIACTFEMNGTQKQSNFVSIALAKGKYFGGGIGIAPDAELASGKIHVTLIGNISTWDYLLHLPQLFANKKITHPEVSYAVTDRIRIEGSSTFEADGELYGTLPIDVTVDVGSLALLNPMTEKC
jgi:diacylglycerol kinase (ATP)